MTVVLAATAAGLIGIGTYLVLQHTLSRIIIGLALISHGGNVLLMSAGRGAPPLVGSGDPDGFADPLAQALSLTAIVITFGVSALLLALAYRSWVINHDDEVQDDVGDRAIARQGHPDKELADWETAQRLPEAGP
ncbi:MAG TPA: NADH-quinone oxidoreductase subunit K [Acidimicrobiales bacterium]